MNRLLAIAAVTEALTGATVLAAPSLVTKLLFGAELADPGIVVSRVAGIALLALGIACWPSRDARFAAAGMLGYNALIAAYFTIVGLRGEMVGLLLWAVAALHAVIGALLATALARQPRRRA